MGSEKNGGGRMTRQKIAVLMGGLSSERDISLQSGRGVLNALLLAGYDAFPVDLTPDLGAFVNVMNTKKPDVVFNALHGKYGEDGCVQGILNLMRIPYTHSGVLASALSMNKTRAKCVVAALGIAVPAGKMVTLADIRAGNGLPIPYVVKPNDEGSSVGVFIVTDKAAEEAMIRDWCFGDRAVLTEEYIAGRELSVAVTDDGPLGVVEIVPKSGFYDFTNKYAEGGARHLIPAPLDETMYQALMKAAFRIHQAMGCRGVSRSDFRLDDTNPDNPKAVFLEVNVNPGMTPLSLVPEIAAAQGISYEQLVVRLVEKATCEN